jgi:hypothetical protein
MKPAEKPSIVMERFELLFSHSSSEAGIQQWEKMTVDEIVPICRQVAEQIQQLRQAEHDAAIQEHAKRPWLVRVGRRIIGWQAPAVPTKREIIADIATRCRNLSNWMRKRSSRPAFGKFDMTHLISKPNTVADTLLLAS